MAVMLLLGSGGDDILWAFQSGTIGATAAGHGGGRRRAATACGRGDPADGRAGDVGRRPRVRRRDGTPPAPDRPRALRLARCSRRCSTASGSSVRRLAPSGRPRFVGLARVRRDGPDGQRGRGHRADLARRGRDGPAGPGLRVRLASVRPGGRALPAGVGRRVLRRGGARPGRARAGTGDRVALRLRRRAVDHHRRSRACWPACAVPRDPCSERVVLAIALAGNLLLLADTHDRFVAKIECEQALTPIARGSAGNPC